MNFPDRTERHSYEVSLTSEFLLKTPDEIDARTLLILTLHGYGSNPADMMRLTAPVVGHEHIVAALQAPNAHYSGAPGVDSSACYNWGISQQWSEAVQLHHRMLTALLGQLGKRFGIGPERTVLMGFSQPVGLNYRFAATNPGTLGGVIAICGGIPRDWEEDKYHKVDASILHVAREEDEFYPASVSSQFPDRLRLRARDVEFHLLPGKHRFPSKAVGVVKPWLERLIHSRTPDPVLP